MAKTIIDTTFYNDVRGILQNARSMAVTAVNTAMVEAYWLIGKRIVEEEQQGVNRAKYGQELIKGLSVSLNADFGKGFSVANLKNFRQFYLTFVQDVKGYTLCSQLSWSHVRLIMRLDNTQARHYYLKESKGVNWSVRQLQRNIQSHYYERLVSTADENTSVGSDLDQLNDFVKDPYVLEFLNLPENHNRKESQFEQAIIDNLQAFLLEMGNGFSFVARQFRISTETNHFFIDLVFYNYLLKCFVIIDLKNGPLSHQDIGQIDMYVRMFDDLKRGEDDNPTIGIILCSDKEETLVKYSVLKDNEQLFASKYRLILPTEKELENELEREIRMIEANKVESNLD